MKKKIVSIFLSFILVICAFTLPVSAKADNYFISGFDVSEHNENIDFSALKAQGYSFVMIRLGYFNRLDNKFYENIQNAVNANINFGVYHYSYAFNSDEVNTEANFVLSTLSTLSPEAKALMTYPIAYDIEDSTINANADKSTITSNAIQFVSTMNQNGYDSMIYSNTDWFNNYIDTDTLNANNIKLWCADYTNTPLTKNDTKIGNTNSFAYMWQYDNNEYDKSVILMTDANNLNISVSTSKIKYNGKSKKPQITVYNQNGQIIPNNYYTVKYSNNKKPGKAKVTVNFSGVFFGSKSASFIITPKTPTLNKPKSKAKKQMTLSWKKDGNVSGYELQYSTSSKFSKKKTKTVKLSKSSKSKTIKKLKSGKKYYVRIRSYKTIDGKKYYSSYSAKKNIKIK